MKKPKVLVIEDEPDILEVMEYNLTREGFKVLTARDGNNGLLKAQRELPELLILDLMLPGMDGLDLCRRLRADEVTRSIPVIMNLQGTDTDLSRRLIDFASGLTYALNGGMQKIAEKTFLLTPRNVEVSAEQQARLVEKGFFNQS